MIIRNNNTNYQNKTNNKIINIIIKIHIKRTNNNINNSNINIMKSINEKKNKLIRNTYDYSYIIDMINRMKL
jgi:hypothetical protein